MKSDVVIIGGGIAGLATGALLAKDGYRATVLEKGNQPGGRAYTYTEKGFTLNYGPHAVYRPQSGTLGALFAKLGRPPIEHGWPNPLRSYWADGDRFGAVGAKPHELLMTPLFPFASRLRVARLMLAIRGARPDTFGDMTYGAWLDARVSDPRVRRFALALATVNTYTRPSASLSATFVIRHIQRTLFAKDYVGYMSLGWSSMYRPFIEVLEAGGGHLITGAHVERLEMDGGRVVAAIAAGDRYEADAFVCTLPPQDAPSLAPERSPLAADLARWSSMEDVRALCMDLGFSRRLRDDLSYIYDVERDLYYSLHSEVTPDLAPAGSQLLHAMAYLSPEDAASDDALARRKAELVAGLDRHFTGWREATVVERVLPNVRVATARRTPAQTDAHAVPLRVPSAANLYFAGDARDLPYNLGETSLASAMEVAAAIASAGAPRAALATAAPAEAVGVAR